MHRNLSFVLYLFFSIISLLQKGPKFKPCFKGMSELNLFKSFQQFAQQSCPNLTKLQKLFHQFYFFSPCLDHFRSLTSVINCLSFQILLSIFQVLAMVLLVQALSYFQICTVVLTLASVLLVLAHYLPFSLVLACALLVLAYVLLILACFVHFILVLAHVLHILACALLVLACRLFCSFQ